MRLSTKGRYAVMAMADLAQHEAGNRPVSLADIAQRQEISLSYLEQLFAKLRRGGLVKSVRGPGGGYRLSRPSEELRIADIIMAVDEPIAATRCKPGSSKGCTDAGRALRHPRSLGRTRPSDPGVPVLRLACRRGRAARAGTFTALRGSQQQRTARSGVGIGAQLMHYLDHNATSPLRAEVRAAMEHALAAGGNPSSVHGAGRAARAAVERAREQVADARGCAARRT